MVTRGQKTAKRPTASNRAKTARKPQSTAIQSAQSKSRKPKPGQRPAEKSKSETARLKNLLRAAEDCQTAAAEILKVIASSPSDVQPVFEAIVRSAAKLFEPCSATITTLKDDKLYWNATAASISGFDVDRVRTIYPIPFDRDRAASAQAILERRIIEIPDVAAPDTPEFTRKAAAAGGFRSITFVPLVDREQGIGTIIFTHPQTGIRYSERQLALIQTFADQAVIAIQNARLFNEVQAKTRDLTESLQQQTATADVLKVISRSAFDLNSVLDTLLSSAARLCGADRGLINQKDGDVYRLAANHGMSEDFMAFARETPIAVDRSTMIGRVALDGKTVHIHDVMNDPDYTSGFKQFGEYRTVLGVPLLRAGVPIGSFSLTRSVVQPFTARQIELVETFADQAVIAIENARLFDEVQAKTRDLSEALVYQTGSSNILKVIASSPTDVAPALKAIVESACEICDANDAVVFLKDGGDLVFSAHHGPIPINLERWPINRKWITGRAVVDKAPQHIHDLLGPEGDDFPEARELQRNQGQRTVLSVPLLQEGEAIGAISLRRIEVQPFNDKQIELLKSFADQAVIAISNVRLFEQVQERTRELSRSLNDLRTAQDRLIQTEKLASLGQLTAGIAHEIKNPLNFVNNFSALSADLVGEMNDVLAEAPLDRKSRGELDELARMLKSNLEKVVHHGKRADSIVKNMLLHSREGSGEHRLADINALVDESLNLAYHGARAEKPNFNVTMQRSFDPTVGIADVYPQEITRVLLNLISNGFYATAKRKAEAGDGYEPTVTATTKDLGDNVEIRIRDNGTGIPDEVKVKIFNPFFTTKPAGEGTGLGLSMSHDIIVKQHGGKIDLETKPGQFTEFKIVLPRTNNFTNKI